MRKPVSEISSLIGLCAWYPLQVVLANLYKHTLLESNFACNMVALVDGTPLMLNLKQFLSHFLDFRQALIPRLLRRDLFCMIGATLLFKCCQKWADLYACVVL